MANIARTIAIIRDGECLAARCQSSIKDRELLILTSHRNLAGQRQQFEGFAKEFAALFVMGDISLYIGHSITDVRRGGPTEDKRDWLNLFYYDLQ